MNRPARITPAIIAVTLAAYSQALTLEPEANGSGNAVEPKIAEAITTRIATVNRLASAIEARRMNRASRISP